MPIDEIADFFAHSQPSGKPVPRHPVVEEGGLPLALDDARPDALTDESNEADPPGRGGLFTRLGGVWRAIRR